MKIAAQEVVCPDYRNSFAATTLAQRRPGPEAQRPTDRPRLGQLAKDLLGCLSETLHLPGAVAARYNRDGGVQ